MNAPPPGGGLPRVAPLTLLLALAPLFVGCKEKISQVECDRVVDHFAALVVTERLPDAGAETIAGEQARERAEAKRADEFKNCTSEVQKKEYDCAMSAQSSEGVIKCLE